MAIKILHYFLPFLSSLRAWMPEAELYMISYDGNDAKAREAAVRYNVKVIPHETLHEEVPRLSHLIFGKMHGHLRKLELLTSTSTCSSRWTSTS